MKIFKILYFCILLTVCTIATIYWHNNRTRKSETVLKVFEKDIFLNKLKTQAPQWMNKQIQDDFKSFQNNKISIQAITETFNQIKEKTYDKKGFFHRYRIINNKLYKYFPFNEEPSKIQNPYEKAIKTLSKITSLPDVDFILCDRDGIPECFLPKDFHIVQNKLMQAPVLAKAKTIQTKNVILIPDHYSLSGLWKKESNNIINLNKQIPWHIKNTKAFWRGGSHDKEYTKNNYQNMPRYKICMSSKEHPDLNDSGFISTFYGQMLDTLEKEHLIKSFADIKTHLNYKYLPVLDGIVCTYPGYLWRLLSNSLVFKQQSDEIQWFYKALAPYEHYVPIKNDMSDLIEKINWAKQNDNKCLVISHNATNFVKNNLLFEDIYLYFYKVLKNYAQHQDFSKIDLYKETIHNKNWVCIQNRKQANKNLSHINYPYSKIKDITQPTTSDYKLIQKYLREGKRDYLNLFSQSSTPEKKLLSENYIKKAKKFRLIGKNKKELPVFQKEYFNTTKDNLNNVIICYSSYNGRFPEGIERIKKALNLINYKGHFIYRIGGWPNVEDGSLKYAHVLFAFKPLFFREVKKMGYKNVLWIDSSIIPMNKLDSIFADINKNGYFGTFSTSSVGQYINDFLLNKYNLSIEEANNIQTIGGGIIGLNLNHPIGNTILDKWQEAAENNGFYSARHDQNSLSIISHQLHLDKWKYNLVLLNEDINSLNNGSSFFLDRSLEYWPEKNEGSIVLIKEKKIKKKSYKDFLKIKNYLKSPNK